MAAADVSADLRERLLALHGVTTRRMFGAEAFFVGPAMFAFFGPGSLVLRLPPSAFTEAVAAGLARPFLSLGATSLNGWAELPLRDRDLAMLEPMLRSAHASGSHAARSATHRRRPTRARRVNRARTRR